MKLAFNKKRDKRSYIRFSFSKDKEYVQSAQIRVKAREMARRLGVLKMVLTTVITLLTLFVGVVMFRSVALPSIIIEEEVPEDKVIELELTEYDTVAYDEDTGLPIYDNDAVLMIISESNPASVDIADGLITVLGVEVDPKLEAALSALVGAAEQDGLALEFSGGYVNWADQSALYDLKVAELMEEGSSEIMAKALAQDAVPMPGNSDMQTGLCVTLDEDKETFPNSDKFVWLSKNMADYGFIFRYPETERAEAAVTGEGDYRVLRYVGTENAIEMRQLGMEFEDYVRYYYAGEGE